MAGRLKGRNFEADLEIILFIFHCGVRVLSDSAAARQREVKKKKMVISNDASEREREREITNRGLVMGLLRISRNTVEQSQKDFGLGSVVVRAREEG